MVVHLFYNISMVQENHVSPQQFIRKFKSCPVSVPGACDPETQVTDTQ